MSNLTCPGCGSVYPLAAVQKLDLFKCAVCHGTIVVPIAGPAPSRAAHAEPPRAAPRPAAPPPVARLAPPPAAAPSRRTRAAAKSSEEAAGFRVNWALVGAGAAVLGVTVAAVLLLRNDAPSPPPTSTEPPPPVAAAPKTPAADPAKDPAAWKALPPAERADRTIKYLAALDRRDGAALSNAFTFLKKRDETDAMREVALMELARDPSTGWAHQAKGDVIATDKIERVVAECTKADAVDSPGVRKLAKIRKAHQPESGVWWADVAVQKEIDDAVAQIRADEKDLADPANWAVAKWRAYQRTIDVMKDHPAIDDVAGPYLIFVQVKAPVGASLESVSDVEMNRAKRVLNQNKTLFAAFYDGFHEAFGKLFGATRYDGKSIDERTILKANIFADSTTWELYHQRLGFLPFALGIRAYYDRNEPRFIASYDPGGDELSIETDQVQCHEATHQLMHFYTWDLTRKAEGRELGWSECHTRPLWLDEGFAEFFSSHRRENGKYLWMQPLTKSMEELWGWTQAFQKKRWAMWSLDEMLAVHDMEQVAEQAARRVIPKPVKQPSEQQLVEMGLAVEVMQPLFYCKSWSLVYFLWNGTDAAGKPLYRDAFANFLGASLHATQTAAAGRGLATHVLSASDFKKAMGLDSEEKFRAFEKSWLAWESAFLAKAQKPGWTDTRDKMFAALGVK